jgi:tetratricopeptide (TPR) repeat protein
MITFLMGGKALPIEVLQHLVNKVDGVPLFVEELTKATLESDLLREIEGRYELTGPLPALAIPATLHDALMARLDRLGRAKGVAQLGATLGRTFAYTLLQAVSPWDDVILQRALVGLVEAEVLYQESVPPQASYIFKQALIQEVAYQSLLKNTRQQYHQQIAQVLEQRFPDIAETQPELLAHHYTEASLHEQAIIYWQRAGQYATERSANVEAISHLTKGLEVLKALPDTVERTQYELMLHITLGAPLMMIKGYAAPDVEQSYTRARELSQQVGETPQLFPVLWGLWMFNLVRAKLQTAQELAEQLLRLAESGHDTTHLLEAHMALGSTLYYLGKLAPAQVHFEAGSDLYDPLQHCLLVFRAGQVPGAICLCQGSHALWLLGYPDQALQRSYEALSLTQQLSHPHSQAVVLAFAAMLHHFRREEQLAQEQAEAAVTLSTEQGFAFWAALATIVRGWALTAQGQGEEGIAQMHQGLATYQATGAGLTWPHKLGLLADAYRHRRSYWIPGSYAPTWSEKRHSF